MIYSAQEALVPEWKVLSDPPPSLPADGVEEESYSLHF